jgi:hypothetical protein
MGRPRNHRRRSGTSHGNQRRRQLTGLRRGFQRARTGRRYPRVRNIAVALTAHEMTDNGIATTRGVETILLVKG